MKNETVPATMFANRISEMPFPRPFSLIFSASHMMSAAPAQKQTTMVAAYRNQVQLPAPSFVAKVITIPLFASSI